MTYYPHFAEEGGNIISTISKFYNENIKDKFPLKTCKCMVFNCVKTFLCIYVLVTFDVIMQSQDNVLLLDFGPLNVKSKLYAFNWSEILPLTLKVSNIIFSNKYLLYIQHFPQPSNEVAPVFRHLESDVGIVTPFLQQKMHII